MIYKKFIQISFLNWIEFAYQPWSKFNNLFAFFFVTWDMLFIWHSLRDCKIVERVLNEEILSEMWKKVRNKKLWKEEQMVRVRKSFNQVNTLHQLGKKKSWLEFSIFLTGNGKQKYYVDIYCKESYPKSNADSELLINHTIWCTYRQLVQKLSRLQNKCCTISRS